MIDYKYIIVGGGMTADAAVKEIRETGSGASIAVFSEEKDLPYNRPPLSKGLWKGDKLESIWRKTDQLKIDFFPKTKVGSISPSTNSLKLEDGRSFGYEKLLLATGGTPRRLPFGDENIIYFRTLEDYRKLRESMEHSREFVVIGGGFIGSEIAAGIAMNGEKVTMIFPNKGIGSNVFPPALAASLVRYFADKGVDVISGDSVESMSRSGNISVVKTKNGKSISCGAVVAGLGIAPNDSLAKSAGLATDNGIVVDPFLRTTNLNIFAAGDVANFYNSALGKRMRVEHEDNANMMGKIAGRNMAGGAETYDYLPFFYSDLFDLGYEAVGELDSRLETFEDWVEQIRKGVVYYLAEGVVRGVLLWNTWGKIDVARELINSKKKHTGESLRGLIRD